VRRGRFKHSLTRKQPSVIFSPNAWLKTRGESFAGILQARRASCLTSSSNVWKSSRPAFKEARGCWSQYGWCGRAANTFTLQVKRAMGHESPVPYTLRQSSAYRNVTSFQSGSHLTFHCPISESHSSFLDRASGLNCSPDGLGRRLSRHEESPFRASG